VQPQRKANLVQFSLKFGHLVAPVLLIFLIINEHTGQHWWGQMHCGPPNQNFRWTMAHPAGPPCSAAAPPCSSSSSSIVVVVVVVVVVAMLVICALRQVSVIFRRQVSKSWISWRSSTVDVHCGWKHWHAIVTVHNELRRH